ncbi:MAG: hypothetical protein A2096_06805 [Spirochaetes bacterium GWF1_41_5]|nr:MAG: hypothetical protein A2096_06805 [Spirochaetes bacterium GWF1_41_5]HBE02282.1 hypothetical protein [Spirochaetia bacterium]
MQSNIIDGKESRITVLTPTLIRFQNKINGTYHNSLSAPVKNLKFPAIKTLKTEKTETGIFIDTGAMIINFTAFEKFDACGALTIDINLNGMRKKIKSFPCTDPENLGGLMRKLDGCSAVQEDRHKYSCFRDTKRLPEITQYKIPPGIISRKGWSMLSHIGSGFRHGLGGDTVYFFAYGHDYKTALRDFILLCGRPPMLPGYALGCWFSRFYDYTEKDYKEIIDRHREEKLPLDIIMLDMSWHKPDWYDTRYNTDFFPDMKGFLNWVKRRGLHVGFNHHPGMIPADDKRASRFLKLAGIDTGKNEKLEIKTDEWKQSEKSYLSWDTGNRRHLKAFMDVFMKPCHKDGMDFHWIDGEGDIIQLEENYTFIEKLKKERALILARPENGSFSHHRVPISFAGDIFRTWPMMAFMIEVIIAAGNSAVAFWSHDIGGYQRGEPTAEMYARWLQFGAVCPIFRPHAVSNGGGYSFNDGLSESRRPWTWGKKVLASARISYQLREKLFPYLYTAMRESFDSGLPICRAMYYDYPGEENAYTFKHQYMFGPSLLAAPVVHSALSKGEYGIAEKEVWFPRGCWIDYFTAEVIKGPCVKVVTCPLERFPLYVKNGEIIPADSYKDFILQKTSQPLCLSIYNSGNDEKKSYCNLYEDDGVSLDYKHGAYAVSPVHFENSAAEYKIFLMETRGTYKNQKSVRDFIIRVLLANRPKAVYLDEKPLKYQINLPDKKSSSGYIYLKKEKTLFLLLKNKHIREKRIIVVKK